MIIRKLLFIILLAFSSLIFSQTKEDVQKITKDYDLEKLKELQISYKKKEEAEKKVAYEAAERNGWPITIKGEDGSFQELMKLTPDGFPIYYSTHNVRAARSTRTNFLNSGGGLGLSLDGQGMIARVWDGGLVRSSHNGFGGRAIPMDQSGATYDDHATHVTGTIIAAKYGTGTTYADIKGMAPLATARTFNWTNDESEALSEVSLGMLVSNHSYGVPLTGNSGALPAWYIGSYVEDSRVWDEIVYNSPYYLPVYAAGNDGSNDDNTQPIIFGYDKLVGNKVSKNVLTVANAEDAIIGTDGLLSSVAINASSSQGPTDDRRIKPDIAGNGSGLKSLGISSNISTATMSGTSMAAPNVTGTLLLLQQHYKNLTNSFMKSSTLKGLVCHTADDSGTIGPDPKFGWGLLNAKKAAETLSNNGLTSWLSEEKLTQGNTYSMTVKSNGNSPLIASITWTDVPGVANFNQIANQNNRSLVNDLDIRITKDGTSYFPWRLDLNPMSPAIRVGDNDVDNVEVIKIDTPTAGDYIITITHKGNLVSGNQDYSLVVTGITSSFGFVSTSDNIEICSTQSASYIFNYKQTGSGVTNFTTTGIPVGANVSFSPTSLNTDGIVTMTISNLSNSISGDYNIGIVGNNSIETETRYKKLKVFSATFDQVTLITPSADFNGTSTRVNLSWQGDVNAETYTIQVSPNSNFTSIIINQQTTNTNFSISGLSQETTYYWRVIPSNRCGSATPSESIVNSFKTGILTCGNTFTATDFSTATIASGANSSASIPIEITGGLKIGDMKVNLVLTHSFIQDMTISLRGPVSLGSPLLVLLKEACGDNDDINCRFIDSGSEPQCSGIPSISEDIVSVDPLSSLNGLVADGTWTLLVNDPYIGDGGTVTGFSIEVCNVTATLGTEDNVLNSLKAYPNPAKDIVNIDLGGNIIGETTYELFDIQGRKVVSKVSSNSTETLNIENLSGGIYMLSIQNGNAKTTKKLVINK